MYSTTTVFKSRLDFCFVLADLLTEDQTQVVRREWVAKRFAPRNSWRSETGNLAGLGQFFTLLFWIFLGISPYMLIPQPYLPPPSPSELHLCAPIQFFVDDQQQYKAQHFLT